MIKYYAIRNLGYDGLILESFDTLLEAERYVMNELRLQKEWDEEYPDHPWDKGLIVIRGEVVISDHGEEILGGSK